MQLHIKLNPVTDAGLIQALQAIRPGKRAERIRGALTQALVGGPDLAQAIHRLASAIEGSGGLPAGPEPGSMTQQQVDRTSPEFRANLKKSVLSAFE